jgi:uncharacterized membrane protein YoaK (UPF0700 family)
MNPRVTSLGVNALLAAAGGFLDGFTYVGHGRVFANGMTANVLLLSASVFMRSWRETARFVPPLTAYMAAVWAAQAIQLHSARRALATPHQAVLLLEAGVLLILGLLPATSADLLFTSSIAFVAGVQTQTFREVHGRNYSSTFTTGNLRTLGEAAFHWVFQGRKRESALVVRDFSVIVTAFVAGALAGAGTTKAFGNGALWFAVILLVLAGLRVGVGWSKKNLPPSLPLSSVETSSTEKRLSCSDQHQNSPPYRFMRW